MLQSTNLLSESLKEMPEWKTIMFGPIYDKKVIYLYKNSFYFYMRRQRTRKTLRNQGEILSKRANNYLQNVSAYNSNQWH